MTGALLRSGKISSFKALGKTGQPVYRAALQLRNTIERKDKKYALCLAIPQTDQQGDNIDWYSPIAGDVIPWSAATEEERKAARSRLESVKSYLIQMREELLASEAKKTESGSKDKQVFAALLEYVIHFPGEDFVYLVRSEEGNQKFSYDGVLDQPSNVIPVLTFWGFLPSDGVLSADPLYCLYPQKPMVLPVISAPIEPAVTAPFVAPAMASAVTSPTSAPEVIPVVARVPWWQNWRRWLWWLLALLLLLLALFFLRGCIPGAPHMGSGFNWPWSSNNGVSLPAVPKVNIPTVSLPSVVLPDGKLGSAGDISNVNVPNMSFDGPGINDADPVVKGAGVSMPLLSDELGSETAAVNHSEFADPAIAPPAISEPVTGPGMSPPSLPENPSEPVIEELLPDPSSPTPNNHPASPTAAEALNIPAQANADDSVNFLNGNWKAKGGIQDQRTGKPLRLEYQFDDGQGDVTVRRSDGVSCTGPVSAGMTNGSLAINSQGQAKCSDGGVYDMPAVSCIPDAQNMADCTGRYGNEVFPMTMRNADEQGGA